MAEEEASSVQEGGGKREADRRSASIVQVGRVDVRKEELEGRWPAEWAVLRAWVEANTADHGQWGLLKANAMGRCPRPIQR